MATFVLMLISLFCAVVPMVGFLAVIWWLDRYEREPLWLVGLTFLWGAVGAIFLALIGNFLGTVGISLALGAQAAMTYAPVVVAPMVEEPTKALVLFLVARSRTFDNMTDGFVYGAAAGLGFGMTENFFYFADVASRGDLMTWLGTIVVRTFFSALMHAGATSSVGAALGWSRLRGPWTLLLSLPVGFGVAMGMHGLWNGLLTWDAIAELNGQLTLLNLLLFPLEFATLALILQVCLWIEKRTIVRELSGESRLGLLPGEHVPVLGSALQRAGSHWLPRGVPKDAYIHAATTLAFRLSQARRAPRRQQGWYDAEIARLRAEVRGLLARSAPAPR